MRKSPEVKANSRQIRPMEKFTQFCNFGIDKTEKLCKDMDTKTLLNILV